MSGRKPRTSRTLFLIAVLLCLLAGLLLTQSTANRSSGSNGNGPDMFVAGDIQETPETAPEIVANDDAVSDDAKAPEAEATPSPTPTATPVPQQTSQTDYQASLEATKGVWRPDGSNWRFLIDGTPYTGWLNDTDGHRYYFNSDGIMHTGVLDYENKRYYFDQDGIMQTGDVVLKNKTYHFLEDGSLEGYDVEKARKAKEEKAAAEEAAAEKDTQTKADKTLALTFDDGPGEYTGRLLDCLESNNAKATFFMVGQEIAKYPDEVKRMASLGCELGGHSYTHIDMTTLSADDIIAEVWATGQEIKKLTGKEPTVIRPPYGNIDNNVTAYADNPIILWSVDTLDWETKDTELITKAVLEGVKDGDIVLLHDIYEATVAAAEVFIPELIRQGYELVTVHELAATHKTELQNGTAYNAI